MKSNQFKMLKIAGLLLAAGVYSNHATAADVSATASASVINPISIAETRALNFGKIAGTAAGGNVVLSAADTTATTDSTTGLIVGTSYASGKFTVTGEANSTYTITIPSTVTLAGTAGTDMVATLTKSKETGTTSGSTLYSTGTDVFYVGGSLAVGANQTAEAYSGTYTVTVNYQ